MIEDGPTMVTYDLTRPGPMIIGDAASFTFNIGLIIRGMGLATGSALAAAEAIEEAFQTMDFSRQSMDQHRILLDESFAGKDMATYAKAPAFLECPCTYRDYGRPAAEVFYGIFSRDLTPKRRIRKVGLDALKVSDLRLTQVVGDVLAGIHAL